MKKQLAALLLISVPALVGANEQQLSQELCFKAYSKADEKFQANADAHCKIANDKPSAYWNCVIGRMNDGETMPYAAGRCDY